MLAANELLESLSEKDSMDNYTNCNDDHDFGKVLDFCSSNNYNNYGHKLRYSDGQEKSFSFDN